LQLWKLQFSRAAAQGRVPLPTYCRSVYLLLKAVLSGAIIAAASEVARRSSVLGAVLISLPLSSILAMIWLYRDTNQRDEVAALSWSILWVIPPSLVFFVVLPLTLRSAGFWPSLLLASLVTALAYAAWVLIARRFGLDL
jgi:TRAP-type mannitol/chloroaromatic compound transport system permease large subunit